MNEQVENTNRTPLKPHSYPIAILIAGIVILGLIIYSLIFFAPKYHQAYQYLSLGKEAYVQENWDSAANSFRKVVEIIPSSENTKIELAKTLFANSSDEDDPDALRLLEGIKLDSSDWKEVQKVMPQEYQVLFKSNYPTKR